MRIDTEILKEYVDTPLNGKSLSEALFSIGIENSLIETSEYSALEIEITPNRPDWLSHYGVAREIAARFPDLNLTLDILPEITQPDQTESFSIRIENPDDCPRYSGCILRGVPVAESSPELKKKIEAIGLRSINNIVDISNLVMYLCSHPIHIFDLHFLKGKQIGIRRARKGEILILLDEKRIELTPDHLVITDGEKPVALAGVMGGLNSGVLPTTTDLFIESAYFEPTLIRRTAREFGLKTDASYRFERGMDVENTVNAIRLTILLIERETGRKIRPSFFGDQYPRRHEPKFIELEKTFPGEFTGIEIASDTGRTILEKLGFGIEDKQGKWRVQVPAFRVDITCPEDLVEEIIRIHGYDRLDSSLPPGCARTLELNRNRQIEKEAGCYLTSVGFSEMVNYVFQSPEDNLLFLDRGGIIELKNPLGRDFSQMKNSLLPGLMRNCVFNINHSFRRIMIYEIGNIFFRSGDELTERKQLALAVSGEYSKKDWRMQEKQFDPYAFLTILKAFFQRMRWPVQYEASKKPHPFFDPCCCFDFTVSGDRIGFGGRVNTQLSGGYDLDRDVFAVELDFFMLAEMGINRYFSPWKRFPSTSRDFSFLISKTIPFDELEKVIDELKPPQLECFELIDLFQGEKIPQGYVSYSLKMIYRSGEKTLTTEEANEIHESLLNRLKKRLKLTQR